MCAQIVSACSMKSEIRMRFELRGSKRAGCPFRAWYLTMKPTNRFLHTLLLSRLETALGGLVSSGTLIVKSRPQMIEVVSMLPANRKTSMGDRSIEDGGGLGKTYF